MNERIAWAREGRRARITLQAGPLNVLGIADIRALTAAISASESCTVVSIEAAGERAFCAGVEVGDHVPEKAPEMLAAFEEMARAFLSASPAIVCAANAPAMGGGFELLLLADLALCSTRTFFSLPEVQLAALPPIACALLPRAIGTQRAFDAILTGRKIDAQSALAWGLVGSVVAPEELAATTEALCARLLGFSAVAVRACKRAIRLDDLSLAMHAYRDELLPSRDGAEGIAAFLEKRSPVWAHTLPIGDDYR
uniref:Putative enoyl-CoA dehydratase n=1 Tax=mine drainage metagenome TaxID=410659 RepID=E6Q623_9ZZZZ